MKIANINMLTPQKAVLTTMLATTLAAAPLASNASENIGKKETVETVDKSIKNQFVSVVKDVDEYDSKLIDKLSGNKDESFTRQNKTILRLMMGFMMSIIGGMVGDLRDERGKKYIAKAESASNIGFVSGFVLPGVTACMALVTSVGLILKSLGSNFIKK